MASKKYPLDSLLELRENEADRAAKVLAEAVRQREGAERAKRDAVEAKRRAADEARAIREAELARLEAGHLKAADLMRGDAWAAGVAAQQSRLEDEVMRAGERVAEARSAEGSAQSEVTARKADVDVVEKDRAKWQDRARREAEVRDEEEAAEAWRPRRG
jgi:hypothetical protein